MKSILSFILMCAATVIFAQSVVIEKTYGGKLTDQLIDIEPLDDGYALLGVTFSYGNGGNDYYLIKVDLNGDTVWTKTYGDGENDSGMSLLKTSDGGLILAGTKVNSTKGDGWIVKVSSTGHIQWDKTVGGSENDYLRDIIQTNDGGYLVCGFSDSYGSGKQDAYLVKIDSLGNTLWSNTYGGSNNDEGKKVLLLSDGNYVFVGGSKNSNYYDYFVTKVDTLGNVIWSKTHGGADNDVAWDVSENVSGNLFVIGESENGPNGMNDMWLLRLDAEGNTVWNKYYGGSQDDLGRAVVVEADTIYLYGQTDSYGAGQADLYLLTIDSSGNEQSAKTFGGSGEERAWTMRSHGDKLLLAGNYDTGSSTGTDYYFLALEIPTLINTISIDINNIQLYPTIAADYISIIASGAMKFEVINSCGSKEMEFSAKQNNKSVLSISSLESGLYCVIAYMENGHRETARFIKQ